MTSTIKNNSSNRLLHDAWFKKYPEKVKGQATLKKRGDRGADAYEEIIEGTLEDALSFAYPPVTEAGSIGANHTARERERLRLLDLALKLELELMQV